MSDAPRQRRSRTDLEEYSTRIPWVAWDAPIKVQIGEHVGWACRICIAKNGLTGYDKEKLFPDETLAAEHIGLMHDPKM